MRFHLGRFILLTILLFPFQAKAATPPEWDTERVLFSAGQTSAFVVSSGDTVHFATGNGTISYRKSTDEGTSLSTTTTPGSGSLYLDDAIASEGSNIYMVSVSDIRTTQPSDFCCQRPVGNIYFRRSLNAGQTWSNPVKLTSSQGALRIGIAVSGSNVHVVWMDYRTTTVWDLYYTRSTDGGVTWQPESKLVAGTNNMGAERPQIVTSGNSVHIAWMDGRDNNPTCTIEGGKSIPICTEVYYKRSLDNGATWEADKKLTNDPTKYSGRPDIAVSNNTVLVLFDHVYDTSGNEQALLRSNDNGTTWGGMTRISNTAGDSTHGSVILDNKAAHIAWFDYRIPGNKEIFYKMSTDNGVTWGNEEQLTNSVGDSSTPLLALTPNYLHVTYLDNRSGTYQNFYRRRNLAALSNPSPSSSIAKAGDVDQDGDIDIFDYNFVLSDFGAMSGVGLRSDFNKNGRVDIFDFNTLISNFGK